jgi:hypothetical protein
MVARLPKPAKGGRGGNKTGGGGKTRPFGGRERDRLEKLFRMLGTDNAHERIAATAKITSLLTEFGKAWSDVPTLLATGRNVAVIDADVVAHIVLLGSYDSDEREQARQWLLDLLITRHKGWNDLVDLLVYPSVSSWADEGAPQPPPDWEAAAKIPVVEWIYRLTEYYVFITPAQRVIATLWILHTHVYDQFRFTPRLTVTSPISGCGKSTLVDLAEQLVANPDKVDSTTAAGLYEEIDFNHPTEMLDEADNLGLMLDRSGTLRAIINSGHKKGGFRRIKGKRYSTFAPMLLSGILAEDQALPEPLVGRSILIEMHKAGRDVILQDFPQDPPDAAMTYVYHRIREWVRDVKLDLKPSLPKELTNRHANNWTPLIAIADSFGEEWGKLARDAAVEYVRDHPDENVGVVLLRDIHRVFVNRRADKTVSPKLKDNIHPDVLLEKLRELEDGIWDELTRVRLTKLLKSFGIRSKTIWIVTGETRRSFRGYEREQFKLAWLAYCDIDDAMYDTTLRRSTPKGSNFFRVPHHLKLVASR